MIELPQISWPGAIPAMAPVMAVQVVLVLVRVGIVLTGMVLPLTLVTVLAFNRRDAAFRWLPLSTSSSK